MNQIAGNPQGHDEDSSAWKFAHQRLAQILMERAGASGPLSPIMKMKAPADDRFRRGCIRLP
ncbi:MULTISPECIES: hypothetical protein [unclassified Pseudomonas]|uniref:hypothetical protein n=1 Tax=unclassified Pseudomonas TaxID=196821 RepID=UPI000595ACD8|nr:MULTISPECIES: hypothetical protein [unclassified Pseudomonas]MBD0686580.1 hypothetical protein [Pseudomonas sp. PSB18]